MAINHQRNGKFCVRYKLQVTLMTSQEFYEDHAQRMVTRFIWLRSLDRDYARDELQKYMSDPNCPCPDVELRVIKTWLELKKLKE